MTDTVLVDALAQLSFTVQAGLARRAVVHDLSPTQTRLLGVLRDRTPSMAELAALLELDKSSVTGLVDRAEKRRLVTRVDSETDRRAKHVALTPQGHALAGQVADGFAEEVDALVAPLSPAQCRVLLTLVRTVLDAEPRG